jgi:outer membrane protein
MVQYQEPMIVRPFHSFDLGTLPDFDRTLMQGQLVLGYLLFDGGARRGRVAEAEALEDAALARVDGTEQALVAGAVRAYLGALHALTVSRAQEDRVRALGAEADRVRQFLEQGRAAPVDLLRANAALASSRADSVAAAGQLHLAEADLARLTALPVESVRTPLLNPVTLRARGPVERDSVLAAALAASPQLREASARTEAAGALRRGASALWLPTVQLEGRTVAYGAAEARFTGEWQAGVRVSYPIFTGGGRSAGVARAQATEREAEAQQAEVALAITEQVERLLVRIAESVHRLAALRVARDQLAEVVRTEALALREGAGVQSDYLRAEAELARVRAELSEAESLEAMAHVELAQIMGRLTPESLHTIVDGGR